MDVSSIHCPSVHEEQTELDRSGAETQETQQKSAQPGQSGRQAAVSMVACMAASPSTWLCVREKTSGFSCPSFPIWAFLLVLAGRCWPSRRWPFNYFEPV